jgi:hypothetical protein
MAEVELIPEAAETVGGGATGGANRVTQKNHADFLEGVTYYS